MAELPRDPYRDALLYLKDADQLPAKDLPPGGPWEVSTASQTLFMLTKFEPVSITRERVVLEGPATVKERLTNPKSVHHQLLKEAFAAVLGSPGVEVSFVCRDD